MATSAKPIQAWKGKDNLVRLYLPELILDFVRKLPNDVQYGNTNVYYTFEAGRIILSADNSPHPKITGIKGTRSKHRCSFNSSKLEYIGHCVIHTFF